MSSIPSPSHPSLRSDAAFVTASAALSAAGVVCLLATTRWGIGTSPDSVHYIRAARYLLGAETGGAGQVSAEAALNHFAPLYPILLAAGGLAGADPFDGARWIHAFVFGFNIFLAGWIARSVSRYTQWAWVAAPLLMVASVPVVSAHAVALSEPLFLLLGLAGLFLLAKYLETDRRKWLVTGALSLGLALLARYAGAALLLTGGLAILLFARHAVGRRVRDAALFSVLASLPMLVWLARNLAVGGSGTGRELAFHPMTKAHVWQAVYTVSSWFLVPPAAPNVVRLMVCASVAGALAYVLGPVNRNPPAPAVVRVLSLFVVAYAAFLVASLSFFDANTPLDDRILLPAYVAIVIVLLYLFDRFWGAVRGHRLAIPAAMVLALFVGAHAIRGAGGIANGYAAGWGFTGAAWRDSATLAEVRRLPASARIFSNAPEAIYLHTGRTADGLPRKVYLMTAEANRGFAGELQAVGAELERSCGVLVYFRRLSAQKSVPGEGEIRARLSLSPRTDKEDGVILSPAACR